MRVKQNLKLFLVILVTFFFSGLKSMLGVMAQAKIDKNPDDFGISPSKRHTATLRHLSYDTIDNLKEQLSRIKSEFEDRELKNLLFGVNEYGELVIEGTREQFEILAEENEELESYIQMACRECMVTTV